jgi:dTDP-4-amino-4,6-dideoxygalactose transaminase
MAKAWDDSKVLALLGGAPAFEQPVHVGRPNIGDRDRLIERIDEMLERRWLTNRGPFVVEFERRIADLVGVRHCIAMCNATVALEIAIRALGLRGEVIVPSFTFVATAHALQWQEITPVFCDLDPTTHNIDPIQVERMITPRTSGIIGVHVWGRPCDTNALQAIAARRGIALMYDAAHAFHCGHQGKMIGSFGSCEVFSFHATKFLNTFEGGAVVTNDDQLAARLRLMQNFGFTDYDNVEYIGTNGKMSEVSAAMGLTGLESLSEFVRVNLRNYQQYVTQLEGIPGLSLIRHDRSQPGNFQYVVAEVDAEKAGLSRDELQKALMAENVLARRYFYPGCHRMEPYRSYFPHARLMLPNTEWLSDRVLVLPTGTALSSNDISTICNIIRLAIDAAPDVRRAVAASS